jgi:hypothetical protein
VTIKEAILQDDTVTFIVAYKYVILIVLCDKMNKQRITE